MGFRPLPCGRGSSATHSRSSLAVGGRMADQPTTAVQDYLKAIYRVGGEGQAAPADIAALLAVKAPSVTGMLKRLADAGWVEYTPGSGAKLSPAGRTEALRVIRRHRLIELFLAQVLGLDWSEVDTEAEALEHAISPRLEQAIADHLGEPLEDPHGHLIPSASGELRARTLTPWPTSGPAIGSWFGRPRTTTRTASAAGATSASSPAWSSPWSRFTRSTACSRSTWTADSSGSAARPFLVSEANIRATTEINEQLARLAIVI